MRSVSTQSIFLTNKYISGELNRYHNLRYAIQDVPSKTKLLWSIYMQGFSDRDQSKQSHHEGSQKQLMFLGAVYLYHGHGISRVPFTNKDWLLNQHG